MGTREGKESLRSKEAWEPLVKEFGASKMLTAVDGELHKQLRAVMKRGFSKESIKGRYQEVLDITRTALQRDWKPGKMVPVVEAMQHIVVEQLGMVLTGQTPRERTEEHTSELQSLMRISYAVFRLKKKNKRHYYTTTNRYSHIKYSLTI